jgi:acetoacetate decarboxylase
MPLQSLRIAGGRVSAIDLPLLKIPRPVAGLPVREIVSATHIVADLTLGLGTVVYDYLKP